MLPNLVITILTLIWLKYNVAVNLVGGVEIFPIPIGIGESLKRSQAVILHMEAVGCWDVAIMVQRNLSISHGLQAVDTLLPMFHIWEVLNFE